MADVVPAALQRLDTHLQSELAIVQQARDEDLARVKAAYAEAKIAAEVAPFFSDLPARIAAAQLVIARSGASTLTGSWPSTVASRGWQLERRWLAWRG